MLDTQDAVTRWLQQSGFGRYADSFANAGVRGARLLVLTREDLADLGVIRDDRGELKLAIDALNRGDVPPTAPGRCPVH
jgi:SAM (Sterile alpha motif) domain-containing protein